MCDNKFHTSVLSSLLASDSKFGFIVVDGSCSLYGTLSGNTRSVLYKFSEDLPKKHGRGGQSANRFARIRDEARHNYLRKVAEHAAEQFIKPEGVLVEGLILAGCADFKNELAKSDLFDDRLRAKVLEVVDVSYGGESGFNEAIELAADCLGNVKFVQEKKLLESYFLEISLDSGKFCFGVDDTLHALELGAVETLLVWENLDVTRHVVRDSTGSEIVIHTRAPPPTASHSHASTAGGISALLPVDRDKFIDKKTGLEMERVGEPQDLVEWLSDHYGEFGARLELVTDKSSEGSKFVNGLTGIGALLRYKVEFEDLGEEFEDDEGEVGIDEVL